jgi:hypothetical protein
MKGALAFAAIISVSMFVGKAEAETLTFEAREGEKWYRMTVESEQIRKVTSTELSVPGSAQCNVVYHLTDKNAYILGGCNLEKVPLGSAVPGDEIFNNRHGRLRLKRVN